MRRYSTYRVVGAALLAALLWSAGTASAHADDRVRPANWKFAVDAHLWIPAIGGRTGNGDDIDIDFDTILRNLDFGLMGGVGARKNRFSVFTDFMYMDAEGKNDKQFTVPVGPPNKLSIPVKVDGKVNIKSWVVTAAAGYNLIDAPRGSLDAIAGVRYLWADLNVNLDVSLGMNQAKLSRSGQISGSNGNLDGIVGIRGQINLDQQKRWYLGYYGDLGTGESDFTWAAQGTVGYHFKNWDVYAGYRYMAWNLDQAAIDQLNIGGFVAGARYRF